MKTQCWNLYVLVASFHSQAKHYGDHPGQAQRSGSCPRCNGKRLLTSLGTATRFSASMPPNRPCLSVWCGATCCPRPEGTMSFRTGEYCAFYTIVALKHLETPCKICKTVVQAEVDTSRLDLTNWVLDLFSFECLHTTRLCAHSPGLQHDNALLGFHRNDDLECCRMNQLDFVDPHRYSFWGTGHLASHRGCVQSCSAGTDWPCTSSSDEADCQVRHGLAHADSRSNQGMVSHPHKFRS